MKARQTTSKQIQKCDNCRNTPPPVLYPVLPLTQRNSEPVSTWVILSRLLTEKEKTVIVGNILHSNPAKVTTFMSYEKVHRN